jgi:hypothetical protein
VTPIYPDPPVTVPAAGPSALFAEAAIVLLVLFYFSVLVVFGYAVGHYLLGLWR